MILAESEKEEQAKGLKYFIPVNQLFTIESGYKLVLTDVMDAAIWEAIKNCKLIAKERGQKDHNGLSVIDGDTKYYGPAELYVERPGEETKIAVSKKTLRFKAEQYIHGDSESERIKKAKVLGRDLKNAYPADVLYFLVEIAEKNPQKIIDLYEGEDWKMHLFILEAIDRGVIKRKEGIYQYDDKLLGASIEATITFLKDYRFNKILQSIKMETYPEYMSKSDIENIKSEMAEGLEGEPTKTNKTPKK